MGTRLVDALFASDVGGNITGAARSFISAILATQVTAFSTYIGSFRGGG